MVWPTKNQRLIKQMGLRFEEMSYKEVVAADGTVIPDSIEGKMADRVETIGLGEEDGKRVAIKEDERSF